MITRRIKNSKNFKAGRVVVNVTNTKSIDRKRSQFMADISSETKVAMR